VYEGFDRAVHLIEPFPIPPSWRRVRAVDFGYTNAFVCQWWAFDEDGRMYLYREIYHTKRTVRVHSEQIKKLERWYRVGPDREWLKDHRGEFVADPGRERISATITDHDAEDRATLEENGIPTYAAIKDFSPGQQAVEERLKVCGDGRPRLFIFRDAPVERDEELAEAKRPTNTAEEFECYVWAKDIDGRPTRERPVKEHDHGMDAMRYVIMSEDKPHGTVGIAGPAVAIERERRNFIRGSIAGPDDAQQRWDRTGAYGNPDEMSPENNWGLGSARSSRWPRR
jgi:phage terminase large subunit